MCWYEKVYLSLSLNDRNDRRPMTGTFHRANTKSEISAEIYLILQRKTPNHRYTCRIKVSFQKMSALFVFPSFRSSILVDFVVMSSIVGIEGDAGGLNETRAQNAKRHHAPRTLIIMHRHDHRVIVYSQTVHGLLAVVLL